MRKNLLSLVLGVGACASSSPVPETGASSQRTIQVPGVAGKLTVVSSTRANVAKLAFTANEVWAVLPAALDSLGIKGRVIDATRHVIGVENFKLRVQLGRTPLSRYLDCGETQIGPNADSYEVLLTVLAQVHPAESASSLSITVEAAAKPIAFRQDYMRCSTKGLLESRLVDAVKKQLQH